MKKVSEVIAERLHEGSRFLTIGQWRVEADAILRALSEAGYAVVPVEPTEAMLEAGARAASGVITTDTPPDSRPVPYDECDNCYRQDWRNESAASWTAMLNASREKE